MMTKAGMIMIVAFLPFFLLRSEESENPYETIALRNPFGLKSPPPLEFAASPATPQKPLPEITLTGIADFSLKKWALLVAAERGKAPKSYTLTEGQQADGLEVVSIDVHAGKVQIRLNNSEVTLSFKEQEQTQFVLRSQERKFVDEHTRAHELREMREAERRARERALVESQNL